MFINIRFITFLPLVLFFSENIYVLFARKAVFVV